MSCKAAVLCTLIWKLIPLNTVCLLLNIHLKDCSVRSIIILFHHVLQRYLGLEEEYALWVMNRKSKPQHGYDLNLHLANFCIYGMTLFIWWTTVKRNRKRKVDGREASLLVNQNIPSQKRNAFSHKQERMLAYLVCICHSRWTGVSSAKP